MKGTVINTLPTTEIHCSNTPKIWPPRLFFKCLPQHYLLSQSVSWMDIFLRIFFMRSNWNLCLFLEYFLETSKQFCPEFYMVALLIFGNKYLLLSSHCLLISMTTHPVPPTVSHIVHLRPDKSHHHQHLYVMLPNMVLSSLSNK